jgi:hypothetical protein
MSTYWKARALEHSDLIVLAVAPEIGDAVHGTPSAASCLTVDTDSMCAGCSSTPPRPASPRREVQLCMSSTSSSIDNRKVHVESCAGGRQWRAAGLAAKKLLFNIPAAS